MAESRLAFVTRRPVAISMFMLAMGVFGAVSLAKLPLDLLPEISYPTLTVRTTWPGAAPEDVEERVSEKVQEALSTLDDLVRSYSISRAGVSDVVLDFDWGTKMAFAVQDVREKLDGVPRPTGAERPLILRYDPNLDPVLRIGVRPPKGRVARGEADRIHELLQLRWLADERLQREIEAIEGVAAVQVRGGLEEEIRVRVDPHKMAALRVDPNELGARLADENINASGGSLHEGSTEYLVRTVNQFTNLTEIEELPVARRGEAVVRVRDVGRVERTYKKREVVSRIGGAESVELAIFREAGANIVELAERVGERVFGSAEQQRSAQELREQGARDTTLEERSRVDFLAWTYRDELEMEVLSDQSIFIRDAVNDVKSSAVLGGILAVGVIWLSLQRLAPTLIIGISIPISIIVTFAPMFMAGISLNIMSLGGLALGVGMLVDNAIVVLESITRCREEGDGVERAAIRGLSEVAGAVTASTLTTVCVFAPIVFVTGIAGQMFGDQALTVVSSLSVSLVVAVLLIPMLASRRLGFDVASARLPRGLARAALVPTWPVRKAFDVCWRAVERVYPRILRASLAHPFPVILCAAALFWLALARVPGLGLELLPEVHQGEFTAHVKLDDGTPLPATDAVLSELDRTVRALPGVATTALTVGVEKETLTREIEGPHTGRLTVRVAENARRAAGVPGELHGIDAGAATIPLQRSKTELEIALEERVRALLAAHPDVSSVEIQRPTPFALESPIAVEIRGYDLSTLEGVASEVEARLAALPGTSDVQSTVRPGHPEARITFDREKTLELGLDLAQVSALVRDQVLGNVSTRFHEGDDRIDIRVQGDEIVLGTLESVLELPVNPAAAMPVPLRSVARLDIVQGPAEIRRIGNTRAVIVSAKGTGLDLGGLARSIEDSLATLRPPRDVTVALGGQKREMDEAQSSMRFALLLAVFLVYVVMAVQFESLLQPFVILLTVPLAVVGVVFTLDALDIPLSVLAFIGLILLAGVVVNNAIVFVDRINQKRREGLALVDAVMEAGHSRLRPIYMTTATTVLGLLPMTGWLDRVPGLSALGGGEGAELRAPLAITVIAGLTSSTLLTLVVIPTVYALICRRSQVGALAIPSDATDSTRLDLL